jgi:2-dehydro-3-deoxyphosphogluconate aldolase/(4S)-4-hydroxy-2-oxoglutarate aldolase
MPLARLAEQKVAAVVQAPEREALMARAEAASSGGLRLLALPVSIPFVAEIAAELADRTDVTVAISDVVALEHVAIAAAAGAELVLSPVFDPVLVSHCAQRGISILSAVATPTELHAALRQHDGPIAVQPVVALGGVEYIAALVRMFPKAKLVAVGGVGPDVAPAYLECGACAVIVDTGLFPKDLDPESTTIISARVSALLEVCAAS